MDFQSAMTKTIGTTQGRAGSSAVVLLQGRPEIWPAKPGLEAFVQSVGATLVEVCASRNEALSTVISFAERGTL
jgi:hypothetical protein